MKNEKKVTKFAVIINIICALIWNYLVFIDLYYEDPSRTILYLHIACAILWDISAVIWFLRYRKLKKKDK